MFKNNKKQNLETVKQDIEVKGLQKISDYFDLNVEQLEQLDVDVLKHLSQMAKLGLQFSREMNLSKRANEMNYIRLSKLVSENQKEMQKYIKKSLPHYFK